MPAKRSARKRPRPGVVSYADVMRMGREMEGVEESTSYGTPALKVKGKLLVRLKEDGQTLVLMTTFEDRERLLAAMPDVFYVTDHYRNYPAVLVRLALVEASFLRELLAEARRLAGGKSELAGGRKRRRGDSGT